MTQAHSLNQSDAPWYKHKMVWFVVLIPALTVVAGIITIIISVQSSDDLVVGDYYKKGKLINHDFEKQNLASELNLTAKLSIDSNTKTLSLMMDKHIDEGLELNFYHATKAANDFVLPIQLRDNRIVVEDFTMPTGKWHVTLQPNSKSWILRGQYHSEDTSSLVLNPYA